MRTSDLLKEARAEIKKGWCQHELYDRRHNVCSIGALDRVYRKNKLSEEEFSRAQCVLATTIDGAPVDRWSAQGVVTKWNDSPWRFKFSVLRMFKKAIKNAKECEANCENQ